MNGIRKKEVLAPDIVRLRLEAPRIAARREPGQFVILRRIDGSERIPLTIVDGNAEEGWIDLIIQMAGAGTMRLGRLEEGEGVLDLVGPLGKPSRIDRFGRCLCIGGGVGLAPLLPIARALKAAGNHLTVLMGARNRERLILLDEMRNLADEITVATEDGSLGRRGFVSDAFRDLASEGRRFDHAVVIGPAVMMKAVSELTGRLGIPTTVSLNPIMIDGTGLCGGCRVDVGGEMKFACVDGPEFDAARIDWDSFLKRLGSYREFEHRGREKCRITGR
ncbi:MAG: sulfide/dihydroorotate dehydrogenase-like FAD/NAD-binding protein [Acidobacteriota bacterium]|nr:sulfide/dihydroorotate dehydrogenase-like FAD/NAD-binding protein [Acidobacteriota bacterium]